MYTAKHPTVAAVLCKEEVDRTVVCILLPSQAVTQACRYLMCMVATLDEVS
jgi:hypothetical protein